MALYYCVMAFIKAASSLAAGAVCVCAIGFEAKKRVPWSRNGVPDKPAAHYPAGPSRDVLREFTYTPRLQPGDA